MDEDIKEFLKKIWKLENPTEEDIEFVKNNKSSYNAQAKRFKKYL